MSARLSYAWARQPTGPLGRNLSTIRAFASAAELSVNKSTAKQHTGVRHKLKQTTMLYYSVSTICPLFNILRKHKILETETVSVLK